MAYRDHKNFFDRELSWLAFNRRVMEEALDPKTPLLERLKFAGIVATNLDEFFMVRVSGVQEQMKTGIRIKSLAGYTPAMQFALAHQEVHRQFDELYKCYREVLLPNLEKQKIVVTSPDKLSRKARRELKERFDREVFPVLTPLAVDSGHPFPRLKGLSLNLIVRLSGMKRSTRLGEDPIAIVQVPSVLPRLLEVPAQRDVKKFILLEDFITQYLGELFPGLTVKETASFRVTRDADIEYKEIDAEDLLEYIESEIRERERGMAVRLEITSQASDETTEFLACELGLSSQQIYRVDGPIALNQLNRLCSLEQREHLKEEPFTPNIRKRFRGSGSIFSKIRRNDILTHHPYESFVPIVDFIQEAADDPKVLAIKQTLYRTSGDSPIIRALIKAAEAGKQVAALVELKARFDEENNIVWARQLEEAGVHVVYGLVGLKTHSKVALVVREEGSGIRRYVHLSTGNYNPITARIYTDIGLFTCDPGFCNDASELFNLLTGYSSKPTWERMIVAPTNLRSETIRLISNEREKAERGKPARIRAKLNSVVDKEIVVELYRASRAGVPIELCVRGICCLKPGVKGISDNIKVWSIVDRFLEHSRIFIFGDNGDEKVFLSSADWMDRNMDRRIEVMFPVLDSGLKKRLVNEIWDASAKDTVKARFLGQDGRYRKTRPRGSQQNIRSQQHLLEIEEQESHGEKADRPPKSTNGALLRKKQKPSQQKPLQQEPPAPEKPEESDISESVVNEVQKRR